jgi:hypothetical protein
VQGTTIPADLVRLHGFDGSYKLGAAVPPTARRASWATSILDFDPGEAAQVDFGRWPQIGDRGTWFFVMTLTWSRHAYAELVYDQTVANWLGCHPRASSSAACRGGAPTPSSPRTTASASIHGVAADDARPSTWGALLTWCILPFNAKSGSCAMRSQPDRNSSLFHLLPS